MFSKDDLSYEAVPLPDRADLGDDDALAKAEAFYDLMKRRHTVRDFTDQPVPKDIIEACIRAAGTARNAQVLNPS